MTPKSLTLAACIAAAYVLHQDWWFWDSAEPLVFGFLPVGFFYHVMYTVAVAGLLGLLVHHAWPHHLDEDR